MKKTILKRSVAILLSFAMLLAYAPGLAYLGVESSKTTAYAAELPVWSYDKTTEAGVMAAIDQQAAGGYTKAESQYIKLTASDAAFTGKAYKDYNVSKAFWDDEKYNLDTPVVEFSTSEDSGYSQTVPVEVGTYYARLSNGACKSKPVEFKITKKNPVVTKYPEAKSGLVYTGKTQELIEAGSVFGGKFVYAVEGPGKTRPNEDFYEDTIPTGQEVGNYTVYYKSVVEDANIAEATGKLTVTIDKTIVPVNWEFDANAGERVLTATEKNTSYGIADQTLTLIARDAEYTGKAYAGAEVKLSTGWNPWNNLEIVTTDDIVYEVKSSMKADEYEKLNKVPVEVGEYRANITVGGETVRQEFKITAAKATLVTEPTLIDDVQFDDNTHKLIASKGEAENGTMYYYVSDEKKHNLEFVGEDGSIKHGWTNSVDGITGKAAGTYYVYYAVKADEGYADVFTGVYKTVTIYKDVAAVATAPTGKGFEYDAEKHSIFTAGTATNGKMMYKVVEADEDVHSPLHHGWYSENWNGWYGNAAATELKQSEAGTYHVHYAVKGATGYKSYFDEDDYIEVVITKKEVTIKWSNLEFVYDGEGHKPTAQIDIYSLADGDNATHELVDLKVQVKADGKEDKWFSDGTEVDAGEYVAKVTGAYMKNGFMRYEDLMDNYKISATDGQLRTNWTIKKRPITIVARDLEKVYGDDEQDNDPYWYDVDNAELIEDWYTIEDEPGMNDGAIKEELGAKIAFTREAGEDAGHYTITPYLRKEIDEEVVTTNFEITTEDADFEITKRPLVIVPKYYQSKVYGEADPTLEYYAPWMVVAEFYKDLSYYDYEELVINDYLNKDAITGELGRVAGENAGEYKFTLGTLASDNYELSLYQGGFFNGMFDAEEAGVKLANEDDKAELEHFGFIAPKFTIFARPITADQITWGKKSFKYDGYYHTRTAKVTESGDKTGLADRDEAFALNVSDAARKVGTYDVEAVLPQDGYYNVNYYLAEKVDGCWIPAYSKVDSFAEKQYIVKNTILAKASPKGRYLKVKWNSVAGANTYVIYGALCGNSYKYIGKAKANSVIVKKINKKALISGRAYKFYVVALNTNGEIIAKSKAAHSIVNNVQYKKSNVTGIWSSVGKSYLTVGETTKVTADQKTYKNKSWLGTDHTAKYRYISSDTSVAKVDKKGKVTATGVGTCKIYVQAVNGMWSTVTIKVK